MNLGFQDIQKSFIMSFKRTESETYSYSAGACDAVCSLGGRYAVSYTLIAEVVAPQFTTRILFTTQTYKIHYTTAFMK